MNVSTSPGTVAITDNNSAEGKYLTFFLGKEIYALNILKVKEIFEYSEVTPIPMMPDFICGALNLRGHAVPVIDLAKRMNRGEADVTSRACIIIVDIGVDDKVINTGILVDSVSKVLEFRGDDIDRAPRMGGDIRTDFLAGMGKLDGQFVILLNIDAVLSMEDLNTLYQAHLDGQKNTATGV